MAFTASTWGQGRLLTGLSPGSSLSGFTAVITKDNLTTSALDTGSLSCLNGGGDWRFSTDINGSTQLDCEIVTCVTNATASSTEFVAWVRFPTYASGTRSVYAFWNKAGQSQPLPSASFGSEAAWQDLEYASHDGLTDVTGNHTPTQSGTSLVDGPLGNSSGAREYNSSGSDSLYCALGAVVNEPFTLTVWSRVDTTSNGTRLISLGDASATTEQANIFTNFAGGEAAACNASSSGSSGNAIVAGVAGDRTTGVWRAYAGIYTSDTLRKCILNGSTSQTDTTLTSMTGLDRIALGVSADSTPFGIQPLQIAEPRLYLAAVTDDFISSSYDNLDSPSAFWTAGAVFVPGGTTLTITESGPSFTDSISSVVTGSITTSIVGTGPSFTDSITVAVTSVGAISGSIAGTGPSFTDAVTISATGNITASITNAGPSFTDSVNSTVTGGITTSIIEAGPAFTDAVTVSVTLPGTIDASIIGNGPGFIEYILTSIPVSWTDKAPVTTTWTDSTKSSTIWQDK